MMNFLIQEAYIKCDSSSWLCVILKISKQFQKMRTVYLKIDLRQTFHNQIEWDREVMK